MKNFFRGVGLFLLAIMVASCASTKAYEVNWPEAQSTLGGKKAVVLNFEMAERTLTKSGSAWLAGLITLPVGGIFYITIPQVIANSQFNGYVKRAKPDVEALQDQQKPILTRLLTEAYIANFNAEVVNANYPFGDTEIILNHFTKPTDQTRETFASICSSNNAEFVIAPISQIISGGRGSRTSFGAGTSTFMTDIVTTIAIFDRAGNVVVTGETHTPGGEIRMHYTTHVEDLRRLFAVSGNNTRDLIRSLR